MAEPRDLSFLESALARKLLTPAQVERIQKTQASLAARGARKSAAEVAVQLKMLDERQAAALSRGPEARARGPAPKKKNSKPLVLALAGGGAALLILVVVVAVATSGGGKPRRDLAAAPPPEEAPRPAPKPAPKPKEDPDEKMKRELEEQRRKFAEEEGRKAQEAKKREEEERKRQEAERARQAEEERAIEQEKKAHRARLASEYEARKRERRAESVKAVEEARRTIEDDRKAEAARQKALAEKLKNQKISLKLKNAMTLDNVVVQGITRDEIKLAFTYEGAVAEQAFPVEFIEDKSYVSLLRAVTKGDGAAGAYEMGRYLVLRKLWKEAQAAFQECVKLDASFQARVPDLSRILNNEAAFKGSARRVGADTLFITYDFSDAAMAQDFTMQPYQPGQLAVENGELKLTAKGTGMWTLKDVEFDREIEVDATVILEENASLVLGAFLNAERKGYLAVINSKTPAGNLLYRADGGKVEPIASQPEPRVAPGAETRIRFTARNGAFRAYVGEQEAIAAADANFSKGWLMIGTATGTARLKKLTVQGKVNPADIDKRFAEVEVLVRRALEADLGRKKTADDAQDPLSAEDEYFFAATDSAFRADYEKTRATLVQALKTRRLQMPHLVLFNPLIQRQPGFAPSYYWRAMVQMAARRADEAKKDLVKALELNPDFFEAHHALALVAMEERDLDACAASAKKALDLLPGFAEAMALGGFVRYARGEVKPALADLELARKLDPSSEEVLRYQRNVQNVIKGPQHLGAKYIKEFPHYIVMTDISPEKTQLYGSRLEAAYKHYAEVFAGSFVEDPRRPKPRVAIFNTREAYLTYGELTLSGRQEWTLGYFHPMYKELLLFEDVDQEATLQTLYHEAFHQFMSLMCAKVPFWFNEGIAEYMGGIRIEVAKNQSKVVERARILAGRLRVLKSGLSFAMPFEQIMMQTPAQFYSGPVSFKYAQAWSMVHFFYEHDKGAHRPRIEAYFRKLKEGGDAREAFAAGFGDAKMDELQKQWLEYVKTLEPPKK